MRLRRFRSGPLARLRRRLRLRGTPPPATGVLVSDPWLSAIPAPPAVAAAGTPTTDEAGALQQLCRAHGVAMFAYSTLAGWPFLLHAMHDPHVLAVARRLSAAPAGGSSVAAEVVQPAQVVLRWALQMGLGVIPGSVTREHIEANARLFHFELGQRRA